jgi:translocation and assembly module TamB
LSTAAARFTKLLTALLAVLLVAVVAAAALLWWWSGTEGSLAWTLQRVARLQPLTVEGVQGSLRDGLHVQRLAWERDGLRIEAEDVHLAWQPLALLDGTIKLDQVSAATLRFLDHRPAPAGSQQAPLSLLMRPRVVLDELKIAKIEWVRTTTLQADDLAGRYSFDGAAHHLRLGSLRFAGGTYSGEASLGAIAPLPLDASITGQYEADVPGSPSKLPLQFTAKVQGPLADLQAQAWLHATPSTPGGSTASVATQATATARITAWAAQPVPQAQADLLALDLHALWPQAPQTQLAGHLQVQPAGTATWQVSADVRNENSGPWDRQRLPLDQLKAQGQWRGGMALVESLDAHLGGGELRAKGQWQPGANGWSVQGVLSNVDPAALHTQMASTPLGGNLAVRQQDAAILFDVDLNGGRAPARKASAPVRKGTPEVAAAIQALDLRKLAAKGRWLNGRLHLPTLQLRTSDASLQASLDAEPKARAGSGRLELQAPGLRANADGEVAETRGRGSLQLQAGNLALAQQWLQRVPGMSSALKDAVLSGRADANVAWQGGWRDPVVQAKLSSPGLQWGSAADARAPPWELREALASLDGRLGDAKLAAHVRAGQGQREVALDVAGRGGRAPLRAGNPSLWQGHIAALTVSVHDPAMSAGVWRLALQRAFDWHWSPSGRSFDMSAGQAVLIAPAVKTASSPSQAVLAWDPVRWGGGELRSAGRLTGLPLGWLELLGGPQLAGSALAGDMVFDAQWDASLGRNVRLNASLARSRGDLTVLAESVNGVSSRVPAGVRDARLTLASQGEQVTLALRWDSERAGVAEGRLATRLVPGGAAGWQWAPDAPIAGSLRAQLPRIGVWSLLAPPGWRLRGSLAADVKAAGTRSDPLLSGTIAADDLALRSVVDGVELRDGRLRAQLDGHRVLVTDFTLHGAGERGSGGTLTASGEAAWIDGAAQLVARTQLTQLRASIRSDRQLTVSGTATARVDARGTEVSGRLKVDRALFVLPEENEPKLGSDVVVRGAPSAEDRKTAGAQAAATPSKRQLSLAVDLDFGDDFQVRGRGLQTRLRGTLALSGQSLTAPSLNGIITVAGGEYRAYNQQLDVERGVLRFTGRIDNPALDILAIRPYITQRVGVQITGTAQAPFVRLYAEPDLPDAEKLAWLLTGRAAPSGGAESALVQEAALAFLSSRRPGSRGVASVVGLDELSVRRDTNEGAVVTLGKRFARNFYASYERSLSGALGTLYIFYDVSKRLTVRAQAGERAGVDLIFTFSFD